VTGRARAAEALGRVLALLDREGVPVVAVGGLAAQAHGARRRLVDLDFCVPDAALSAIAGRLEGLEQAPTWVESEHWELHGLAATVAGCRVEIAGAESARYRAGAAQPWRPFPADPARAVSVPVLGTETPVMPLRDLIKYKAVLRREVDLVDLHYLAGVGGAVDTRLAVYGTLAPGERNAHVLGGLEGTWFDGVVHGERHERGWGRTFGFPALAWHPDAPAVPLKLFVSPDLPAHWDRLDRFEGSPYRRTIVPVTLATGERVLAHIYVVVP